MIEKLQEQIKEMRENGAEEEDIAQVVQELMRCKQQKAPFSEGGNKAPFSKGGGSDD